MSWGGAGAPASGGVAGAMPSGGAGATAAGGAAGAVSAAYGAECEKTADCVLVRDCCGCRADAKRAPAALCDANCTKDSCTASQIQAGEVACVANRCVLARSCNTARVTCLADPSECPAGTIHSVVDACWGPCIALSECNDVKDCTACTAGTVCVRSVGFNSLATTCVTPAPSCTAGAYCSCLQACPVACGETDGVVLCSCPGC
jgi:hypothetical protein